MVLHRARLRASKQLQARLLPSTEYEKFGKFQGTKNGGDFNTKKCWFYRGRGQILTLGPFLGLQGLKHSLSLRDGFFPSKPPFSHLQAGPFQDVPVLARFLGARKTLLSFSFPFTSLLAIW